MSVFSTSWRGSLLATALCAMLGNSPSPAAADDNPTPPQTTADREALHAKFQAIRERAAALDEQGKHDEADRLRREAKDMMSKSGIAPVAPGDSRVLFVTPGNPEQDKIMARLKEMGQKVIQLESEGKHDQAEQLTREAHELYGKLNSVGGHTLIVAGPSPERQNLYEYYKALQGKIEAANKDGNEEQVRRLMQEMDALRAKLRANGTTSTSSYTSGGGESDARLQHLRAAAENLMAAGCKPEAQHVMELIGHVEAETRAKSGLSVYALNDPMAGQVLLHRDTGSSAAVQELRAQMEQMRAEMREMRDELNREKNQKPR